jgi:hypothetical protein
MRFHYLQRRESASPADAILRTSRGVDEDTRRSTAEFSVK